MTYSFSLGYLTLTLAMLTVVVTIDEDYGDILRINNEEDSHGNEIWNCEDRVAAQWHSIAGCCIRMHQDAFSVFLQS